MVETRFDGGRYQDRGDAMITIDIDYTVDLGGPTPLTTAFARAATPLRQVRAPPRRRSEHPALQPVPEPRLPIAPGRVLCDRYVLTQLIGTGGACTVFRARDLQADQASGMPAFVALKTPRPDNQDRVHAVDRLRREFEYAQRLPHDGIAKVFELANDDDTWFMTMELLEGESLAALLRREPGAHAAHFIRTVLRGLGEALAYAHAADIVHGDLNPANVFVCEERVKVLDFGAACRIDQPTNAAAPLAYASPQVLEGAVPQIRDDVFSVACIAYELLTGRHPFGHRPASEARKEGLRPAVPSHLTNEQSLALMSALAWESEARPDDIRSFARSVAPEPQRRRAVAPLEPPQPRDENDNKRWRLIAGACVVAMIVAVTATRLL